MAARERYETQSESARPSRQSSRMNAAIGQLLLRIMAHAGIQTADQSIGLALMRLTNR